MARSLVLLVVISCTIGASWAQNGRQQSRVSYTDYDFPTYAQPWTIGQNVCAYLKDRLGNKIYTTCFPYQQRILGSLTQFVYDCCPGYQEDRTYENYRGAWQYNLADTLRTNCLKKVSMESTAFSEMRRLKVDDNVINYIQKSNVGNQQVTYFVETGRSYKTEKYNNQASNDNPGGHIVKGIHRVKHLANGELLTALSGSSEQLKVTRYSNGIICIDCARAVSVNHPARNAIIHFVDRHIYNKKGKSTANVLRTNYAYFWKDIPKEVQSALEGNKCGKWYTVFVPTQQVWNDKTNGLSDMLKGQLAKAHIVASLICSAAIVKTSRGTRNLNGDTLQLGANSDGGRWVRLAITGDSYTANFRRINGEFEIMTSNGVIYEIDNSVEFSGTQNVLSWSYIQIQWRNYLRECIQLDSNKRYIFIVPTKRGLDWFLRGSDFTFNDEEQLHRNFKNRFNTDREYRCYVAKYHVLEVSDKKTALSDFWSQFFSLQRGYYKSLAFHKTYKENVMHLDLFMNQDDVSQLIWQYSYARDFRSYPVREGHVYEIDFVNIPPEEKLADFLKRRADVKEFYKVFTSSGNTMKLHVKRKPVQLILAFANGNFLAKKLKWKIDDFLALHWVDLYFWIGDLGYLQAGERTVVGSGLNGVQLYVYRTKSSNEYYVWWQQIGKSMTMAEARRKWVKILYYNFWKLDAMVWILKSPLQCTIDVCKRKQKMELVYFAGVGCTKILDDRQKNEIMVEYKKELTQHQNSVWTSPSYMKRFGESYKNAMCFGKFEIAYEPRVESVGGS